VFVARPEWPGAAWAGGRGRGVAGLVRALRGGGAHAVAAGGGWADGQGCGLVGGVARGIYSAQPRHRSGRGTAAPRSVARQGLPRQRFPNPVVATSAHCCATMHGAA